MDQLDIRDFSSNDLAFHITARTDIMTQRHIVYHIPVCPFSQRLEILLALRGRQDAVDFQIVDITRPRNPDLLAKTRRNTALPVYQF